MCPAATSPPPWTRWPWSSTPTSTRPKASAERARLRAANAKTPSRELNPFDAILATVDAAGRGGRHRLGLMLVVGQPKNTAEYIQASSRVGRDGRTARTGGHSRELGPAPRPRPLRAVPALPRDVLRPGRGAVGDPVLGDVAGTWPRRSPGQRRPRAGCQPAARAFAGEIGWADRTGVRADRARHRCAHRSGQTGFRR